MSQILFTQVNYTLGALMSFIELGTIGLPHIQRPFVWKNTKVRDLFDSMYRGYPVGNLLLWQYSPSSKQIGVDTTPASSSLLIVDGQQRLTSLYAVIKAKPVVRQNYESELIEIAFNPLTETFEVADAAIRKDPLYIPNISALWSHDSDVFEVAEGYVQRAGAILDDTQKKSVKTAIGRLHGLTSFPLTALQLAPSIDDERVAEVFVRINSQGEQLDQADFILTLMSVFWEDGRKELEEFCRSARSPSAGVSPFNHFIQPNPDHLLRAAIGLGFKRARLRHVYSILRGKDLETGEFDQARRDEQFNVLRLAQDRTLSLQHWHDFFKAIHLAGFRSARMITSLNNLIYSYTLYLLGRTEYSVPEADLRRAIGRWYFMCSLTGRYTSSPESTFETDLARTRSLGGADEFLALLDSICETSLPSDFWSITLPADLASSYARSPALFAYDAALVVLDAKALYSIHKISDLLDPAIHAPKPGVERHHLFPKAYLAQMGWTQPRDTNQLANYAFMEWRDNLLAGGEAPAVYAPKLQEAFGGTHAAIRQMHYWHALPDEWASMPYGAFLTQRRELMARVIQEGFKTLGDGSRVPADTPTLSISQLVASGETDNVEFKAALRMNLHTGERDPRIELACLKTIAGFLNHKGGTLVIGVADDGTPVGIGADEFITEDRMYLHLTNLIRDRIGAAFMLYIHPRFTDFDSVRVLSIECQPSKSPVYVKDGGSQRLYVRAGASTVELGGPEVVEFVKQRF